MKDVYLMICGPGESGKDEFAGILKKKLPNLAYKHPTSYYCIEPFYAEVKKGMWTKQSLQNKGLNFEGYEIDEFNNKDDFYASRRSKRDIWGYWVGYYNTQTPDNIRLYTDAVAAGEKVFVGLRKVAEYDSFRKAFPTFSVWVQRDSVKHDPTQEYGAERCDFIVQNNGTIQDLDNKITYLVDFFVGQLRLDFNTRIDRVLHNIKV